MRTIGELIQDVNTAYNKGVGSDDTRLVPRYVYSKLLAARNRLINQQGNSTQKIGQAVYQTLPCIEMETAPIHECACLPPKGCTIYRSKYKLPQFLVNINDEMIQSVSTVTGEIEYHKTTWEEKKHTTGRRYVKKIHDYYIRNHRLYITAQTGPTTITLTGIFADPIIALSFKSFCDDCIGNDCVECDSPLDIEFPIDGHKVNTLVEMVVIDIRENFSRGIEDRTNDSADSPEQQSK